MGMKYQKIHACLNDCILHKDEFEEMYKCSRRGASRYKVKDDDECSRDESTKKGPPTNALWYLFANRDDAKDLK